MRRLLAGLIVLGILAGCGGEPAAQVPAPAGVAQVAPTDPPTAAPTKTAVPTKTPRPTLPPKPTRTPGPTATRPPTHTPEPTPTPTLPPEPITIEGRGQSVTDPINIPFSLARVTLAHDGDANFIVKKFKGDDEELLVNAIGRYAGDRMISGGEDILFEIKADGAWAILLRPMEYAQAHATNFSGLGDSVSGFFEPSKIGNVPYTFTHDGEANFIVILLCGGGADYVQNEIGAVNGQAVVKFAKGPCVWDVKADGNWTIAPK